MDKYKTFKKLQTTDAVFLYDEYEDCVIKVFVGDDGETVCASLKKKGKEPYKVDITAPSIFDIMNESEETTKDFYDNF